MKKGANLHLHVIRRFEPVTLSPVVLVSVQETGQMVVAKCFDRRFNPLWREQEDCEPWDESREKAYCEMVESGESLPNPSIPVILVRTLRRSFRIIVEWASDIARVC